MPLGPLEEIGEITGVPMNEKNLGIFMETCDFRKPVYENGDGPISQNNTVDRFRNPAPPGLCLKPCKSWDKLPTSTGFLRLISEQSKVL